MIYKFRGQVRKKGEKVKLDGSPVESKWVYGGLCQGKERSVIYGGEFEDIHDKHVVYNDTIGLSTGEKDSEENEVFQGDIVNAYGYIGVVCFGKYRNKSLGFYIKFTERSDPYKSLRSDFLWWVSKRRLVVIGNIYDNQELLGES